MSAHRPRGLRIVESCDLRYADMPPVSGGRHCAACDRVIPNLSEMTRREATALVHARGGQLCGFLRHDARGEPVFAPERPEDRRGLLVTAALATALAACEPSQDAPVPSQVLVEDDAATHPRSTPFVMQPLSATPDPTPPGPSAEGPGPSCATSDPGLASEAPSGDDALAEASLEAQTDEDRALEARKRRRRRVTRIQPHAQMLGMLML